MSEKWLVLSPTIAGELSDDYKARYDRVLVDAKAPPGHAFIIDPDTVVTTNLLTGTSWSYRESADAA